MMTHAWITQQPNGRNPKRTFSAAIFLYLVLASLLVTSCAPQVSTPIDLDPQPVSSSTPAQNVNPTDTPTLLSPISTPTTTPTATPQPENLETFLSEADAYVRQSEPGMNFGEKSTLRVDGGNDPEQSVIRFTVTKVTGAVESAILRLYTTTNGSNDGPAVYASDASWSEDEITWNNRPTSNEDALDNVEETGTETWVEYDVTAAVAGNGTYDFVLVPDSKDAVQFSSREGDHPPELVVSVATNTTSNPLPTVDLFAESVTFVGAGDISMCSNDHDEQTAELLDTIPGTVFTTGDNAYSDGSVDDFTNCYGPTWGRHKDRTKPIPGNHDYDTEGAAGYYQYFDRIPPYYVYTLGTWRIYALNSEIAVEEDSAQAKWLREDLAAHPTLCVLAYWHRPRWSSGTEHGNDADMQTFWKILYDAGAELVLSGHEHNYERFDPMDAKGQPDPLGLRQIVIGTGGGNFYPFGTPQPSSEVRNDSIYGVLKLTLRPTSYVWEFVPVAGSTFTDSGSENCH